jgi:hypothetical protein
MCRRAASRWQLQRHSFGAREAKPVQPRHVRMDGLSHAAALVIAVAHMLLIFDNALLIGLDPIALRVKSGRARPAWQLILEPAHFAIRILANADRLRGRLCA